MPETRIQSIPEVGAESSSGSINTEFNIDEQDPLLASVMCSSWTDITSAYNTAHETDFESVEMLRLGTARDTYLMIKKYFQTPASWEVFTGVQVNGVQISMSLNDFVKMTWDLLGANNPKPVTSEPMDLSKSAYASAKTTKSFITRELNINIADLDNEDEPTFVTADKMRQCPSFDINISNNKERTDALGETEAIEMSDGDFVVEGNMEVWNADLKAINLKADAIDGKDKWISVEVFRKVGDVTTTYRFDLKAHLKTPSDSKDGSKLKITIPYSVNFDKGLTIYKFVLDEGE